MACPNHLSKIFHQEPIQLGFCNASGIGAGVVWIDPSRSGSIIAWYHPFLTYITVVLVPDTNTGRKLTNSDLDLDVLVFHEATLLETCPE